MISAFCDFVVGILLFLFVIHYICYIIKSVTGAGGNADVHSTNNNCRATDKQALPSGAQKSTRSVAMQSEDAKYIQK